MVFYVKMGEVPELRHTFDSKERIRREELFGEESFDGPYSLLYHINEPTDVVDIKYEKIENDNIENFQLKHRHYRTGKIDRYGNFINGRRKLLIAGNVKVSVLKPLEKSDDFYRNALNDMIIFVHEGDGELNSVLGKVKFSKHDYIYVPKGLTFKFSSSADSYFLIIESRDNITIPKRYMNVYGQLKEGTPFYTRDIRIPEFTTPEDKKGKFRVYVDYGDYFAIEERETSPMDVVGWDGYLYPWAINVSKMAPIVGKLHQPPPVHETFSSKSMMVGTFLPRKYDFHPRSIPISYYHNNIDVDEFLFYSSGNFMSRKGIEPGSITVHVRGIIHGPQPGAIESAIGKEGTDEVAVMIETYDPMIPTRLAIDVEDQEYMRSWHRK
ncbi:homogentisate 1,2-dioxygenase [Caldiplasma sukawensis]